MSKEEENVKEVVEKTKQLPVALGQVPTQFGLVYQTPEGDLSFEEYQVWLGNKMIEIKEALAG